MTARDEKYQALSALVGDIKTRVDGLEQVQERVAQVEQTLETLTRQPDPDAEQDPGGPLTQLRSGLKMLAEEVASLQPHDHDEPSNGAAQPVVWSELSSDEYATALMRLYDWVRLHLVPNHWPSYRVLPPCWWRHQVLIDELDVLRVTWEAAWMDEEAAARSVAEWKNYWWPGFVSRAPDLVQCAEQHSPHAGGTVGRHPVIDTPQEFAQQVGGKPTRPAWI